jgi:hypothetical protein
MTTEKSPAALEIRTLGITPYHREALDAIAAQDKIAFSDVAREAFELYIRRRAEQDPQIDAKMQEIWDANIDAIIEYGNRKKGLDSE